MHLFVTLFPVHLFDGRHEPGCYSSDIQPFSEHENHPPIYSWLKVASWCAVRAIMTTFLPTFFSQRNDALRHTLLLCFMLSKTDEQTKSFKAKTNQVAVQLHSSTPFGERGPYLRSDSNVPCTESPNYIGIALRKMIPAVFGYDLVRS